jgi:UDP-N-acetyl-D-glucosamine dehydrogenase
MKNKLITKLNNKKSTIGIVGMGYVGLPLILRYAEVGYNVVGFDTDQSKVKKLEKGQSYIKTIPSKKIKKAMSNKFFVTTDFSKIKTCDAIIVCVPTPLNKNREPDMSFIINTLENLFKYLSKGQVLSLESTTYPGTTAEVILPFIKKKKFIVGRDFFLVYSPEREDPGNPIFSTEKIPKVISGYTKSCLKVAEALYNQIVIQTVPVSSTQTAELTKLLENIHRAVNIGLVNEMKIIADAMGIDIHEVINTASTKPFGFTPYYPGPGLGGHCVPIDPFYLVWKAREFDVQSRFIELAGEVNTSMPNWVVKKVSDALNKKNKSLSKSKILLLGVAYKKNVDDMRESPSIKLINLLTSNGAKVDYSDPFVPDIKNLRSTNLKLKSKTLSPSLIKKYDLILIATNHDVFNYKMIEKNSKMIIDTRGIYSKKSKKIFKA